MTLLNFVRIYRSIKMTPFIKKKEVKKDWYIINAENAVVGRLASYISKVLRGKNKPTFNPCSCSILDNDAAVDPFPFVPII